jgi:hypothetical protein
MAVRDNVNRIRENINTDIPSQFPAIYQEEGSLYVEFVRAYYEYVDTQLPKFRDGFYARNVDTADFEQFLIFYKNKYMANTPYNENVDLRFLIKHITDFYRRKGSEESLRLFFRMFFDEEIEVFYPSTSILKLSDSVYGSDAYLEMRPIDSMLISKTVVGSVISQANGYTTFESPQAHGLKEGDVVALEIGGNTIEYEVRLNTFNTFDLPTTEFSTSDTTEYKFTVIKSTVYPINKGVKIVGDVTKAEAFVDEVIFKNFDGAITPIVFVSALNGTFSSVDGLIVTDAVSSRPVGRLIKGSISELSINKGGREPFNKVGDRLLLRSTRYGVEAKGIVKAINETTTGVINFEVEDSGYGYAKSLNGVSEDPGNDIIYNEHTLSNQVLVTDNQVYDIQRFDTITFTDSDVLYSEDDTQVPNYSLISTTVEALSNQGTLVYLNSPDATIPPIPTGAYFTGVNDRTGQTIKFVQSSEYKVDANFRVTSFKNTETVKLIPDIIGDFESVQLDATDYGMSGTVEAETLNTTLRDAFDVQTWVIGEIDKITVASNGSEYKNDVFTVLEMPQISNFDKRNVKIRFDRIDFLLEKGDYVYQDIEIEDLTYAQPTVPYTVRLEFVKREADLYYFRQMSFYDVDPDLPIQIKGDDYNILEFREDDESEPMGINGIVSGRAFFAEGQISEVTVTETGYRYLDGEEIEIINNEPGSVNYGNVVATAVIKTRGTGFTQGKWKTASSFLNDSTKVIRDNEYYQEYSFDISSIVNPDSYENLVKQEVAPAGTKLFSSPLINSFNNFETDVDMRLEVYTLNDELYAQENDTLVQPVQARFYHDGNPALPRQTIQVNNAVLVEDETDRINEQINS